MVFLNGLRRRCSGFRVFILIVMRIAVLCSETKVRRDYETNRENNAG